MSELRFRNGVTRLSCSTKVDYDHNRYFMKGLFSSEWEKRYLVVRTSWELDFPLTFTDLSPRQQVKVVQWILSWD